MQEIERKFLLPSPPSDIVNRGGSSISQGYIVITEDAEVRIRKKRDAFFLTVKRGRGEVRLETEIRLSDDQFRELWPMTEGRRIEKTRYEEHRADRMIEIDIYHGELSGLLTAEVEFPDRAASAAFQPPPWFGTEVTEDERYKNKHLALHGRPRDPGPVR